MATGELKKMVIQGFKKPDDRKVVDSFTVMFNPTTYQLRHEVQYQGGQGKGTTGNPQKFEKIKPREFSFEFLIDGTGVSSDKKEVSAEVDHFLAVTAKNNGETHRPLFLLLRWGDLVVSCVLKSAEVTYTLFRHDGSALRAKINASFAECIADEKRVAKDALASPDMTHWREVKQGDKLPLLTEEIYGDHRFYLEVARVNGLDDFRNLKQGTQLRFPPLEQRRT